MGLAISPAERPIVLWLACVAALVFVMVVLGGVTRLTESGLSMVNWRPATGWLPPMSESAWQGEFEAYKTSPEYAKENSWMELADFKGIFWFEYLHRLLGRIIGVVFALPFLWFLVRRQIPPGLTARLWGLLVLGGLQGVMGWYMVKSGLVDRPDVSHYRLAAHLGLAFAIYGTTLWMIFTIAAPPRGRPSRAALWIAALIFAQVLSGALVAGLDAGFIYNTWPLIDGHWIATGPFDHEGFWANVLEDRKLVQFEHRMGAYLVTLVVAGFWWWRRQFMAVHILAGAVLMQVGLGIATLVAVVPVWLGALHQAGALIVFSAALYCAYRIRPR